MSRQFTTEEIRRQFLEHVWGIINYWSKDHRADAQQKMEGVAFSILVALDGEAAALPQFIVAPSPHATDRDYLESQGENWYPDNDGGRVGGNIAGPLHEEFYVVRRELGILHE